MIEIYRNKMAKQHFLDDKQRAKWIESTLLAIEEGLVKERISSIPYKTLQQEKAFFSDQLVRIGICEYQSPIFELK